MVRHEGDADPDALRILKVCGNSMETVASRGCSWESGDHVTSASES